MAAASLLTLLTGGFAPTAVFAQGKSTANIWSDPVEIVRKPKANRTYKRRVRQGQKKKARLLTLQWQVLKQNAAKTPQPVDPDGDFYTGDALQLSIKVNQPGFIYVVDEEGSVLFPNERINRGKNFVPQYYKIIIPSNCTPELMENGHCWWRLKAPRPENGRETLFVIFSRDAIKTLPNNAAEARERVKRQLISELKADSPEAETVKPDQRFVTWVTNSNLRDNEELVATLHIIHLKP
jgi:hypothetical protein